MNKHRVLCTTRPATAPDAPPQRSVLTVMGRNALEVQCELAKVLHKRGERLHVILAVTPYVKGQPRPTVADLEALCTV